MTVTREACIVFCILWSVSLNFWSLMVFTSSLTANWQWKTPVCETRQEETRTLFIPHTEKKTLKMTRVLMRHCQGGSPMSPVWILKRLVSVFINACHLLSALPPLSQFAEGGCLLSRFHFMRCRYFLDHVACRNLPWQGLTYARYKPPRK